jgi:thioredoxin
MNQENKETKCLDISDESFANEVLLSPGLTIVDFWAPWCGPCKSLAPKLDELSHELTDKFTKINTDNNRAVAGQYGVRGLPTIILFKDGVEVERMSGNNSKEFIQAMINNHR